MGDQAEALRLLVAKHKDRSQNRIIAVTSGKGGVGKSNFTVNFGIALKRLGKNPIIIDLDIGFANVELLLGTKSRRKLTDILDGKEIWEVVTKTSLGVPFITAGSQFSDFSRFTESQIRLIIGELKRLHERYDVILLDGSAGLSSNMNHLISAADDMILVFTPEPTAISDAYSLVKFLHRRNDLPLTHLVANRAKSFIDAKSATDNVKMACQRFLGVPLLTLGFVLDDQLVSEAVRQQTAFVSAYPNAMASRCVTKLAKNYLHIEDVAERPVQKRGFATLMEKLFSR